VKPRARSEPRELEADPEPETRNAACEQAAFDWQRPETDAL
jgi:hypothetical protein